MWRAWRPRGEALFVTRSTPLRLSGETPFYPEGRAGGAPGFVIGGGTEGILWGNSSPFRPPRMWGDYPWRRTRKVRRLGIRVPRPIWSVFAGSSTVAAFCGGKVIRRRRPIRLPLYSDLEMAALVMCATRRIFCRRRGGRIFPIWRWLQIFRRYCAVEALGWRLDFPRDLLT